MVHSDDRADGGDIMGVTEIPSWIADPNSVKANEFEHGLMLGYLLLPNRKITPPQTEDERTLDDGSVLKTWVEMTKAYDDANGDHFEQYTLYQTKTHTDGTVEKQSVENFTRGFYADILKGNYVKWELAEPDDAGVISKFYYYEYNVAYNRIERKQRGPLPWSILTEV